MRVVVPSIVVLILTLPNVAWGQLADELPQSKSLQPPAAHRASPHTRSEPPATRLIILPTYRVLPAGSGSFGLTEFVMPSFSISPTDFLHLSASASVYPLGMVSAGAKAQLLHRDDDRAGFAVGVTYLGYSSSSEDDFGLMAAYVTAGADFGLLEYHAGLIRARLNTEETSFAGIELPTDGYYGRGRNDYDYVTIVGNGVMVPLPGDADIMFEVFGWDDNGQLTLIGTPAIRFFGDRYSAQVGSTPILVDDDIEAYFIPWVTLTWYVD